MSFISNLVGGSAPKINYTPPGFNAGGINATFSGGKYGLNVDPSRSSAVGQIASTFGQEASALGGLRATVAPGFSAFRQAGLSDLDTQKTAFMSNLKDNLAQRRILGSSFASDAQARAEAEFDKKRTDFIAESYLKELDASNQLIQEQFQASVSGFKTGLDEMNLEAGLAADLTGKASTSLASVATAQAQLDAQNAAGIGKLFGTLFTAKSDSLGGTMLGGLGKLATSFFA